MLDIGTQKPQGKTFAINVAIRDPKGRVLRYKSFESDDAAALHDFWQQNTTQPRKNKKKGETE